MRLIKQASKLFLALTLVVILTITNTRAVFAQNINVGYTYLAEVDTNLGNEVKASVKKAQGKVQETYGNVTGDREAQIEGKVNQAEGAIRTTQGGLEWDIEGKTRQAENNIRRYQARDGKPDNLK